MGTPSKTILNQLRYLHAKFGTFVQRVTIFSLSHLTKTLDLPGPLCYKNLCRFNCILYIGPTLTRTGY